MLQLLDVSIIIMSIKSVNLRGVMSKKCKFLALGLMSGTSMDGVDIALVETDGNSVTFFGPSETRPYSNDFKLRLRQQLGKKQVQKELETELTLFHAKVVEEFLVKNQYSSSDIDVIGFHGQTIFHNSKEKVSKQLGDGKLLSQETKKKVVYDFRQNDLKNGGQGAPLTPIFHKLLKDKYKLKLPLVIVNIGGITNVTSINLKNKIHSQDIGPGNCLIDEWIRKNSKKNFDNKGQIAKSGKIDKIVLNQALENFSYNNNFISYDVKDFDISFVRGLSLKDGAATLTEYTSEILINYLKKYFTSRKGNIFICGGGRKNKFLINRIRKKIYFPIKLVDDFGIDGDFVESQAFAYLAIRSYLNLPITFPNTTGCKEPCSGGKIVKNF